MINETREAEDAKRHPFSFPEDPVDEDGGIRAPLLRWMLHNRKAARRLEDALWGIRMDFTLSGERPDLDLS